MGRHSTSNGIAGWTVRPQRSPVRSDGTDGDALPFAPLRGPVDRSCVALLTGSGVYLPETPPFRHARNSDWLREIDALQPLEQLELDPVDFSASQIPVDLNCLFPLERLHELENEGAIGSVASHHFSLSPWCDPADARFELALDRMAQRCWNEGIDLVIGLPAAPEAALPVSLSLRNLESAGIPTVLLSIAPESDQLVRAPRGYHLDFPSHCPLGPGSDRALQRNILLDCLHLLPRLQAGDFVELPYHWAQPQPG